MEKFVDVHEPPFKELFFVEGSIFTFAVFSGFSFLKLLIFPMVTHIVRID